MVSDRIIREILALTIKSLKGLRQDGTVTVDELKINLQSESSALKFRMQRYEISCFRPLGVSPFLASATSMHIA